LYSDKDVVVLKKEMLAPLIMIILMITASMTFMGCFSKDKKKKDNDDDDIVEIAPVAVIKASKTRIVAGENITFSSADSYDTDGQVVRYFWNFGDGITNATNSTTKDHNYTHQGYYNVTLTIYDDMDLENSTSIMITVIPGTQTVQGQEILLERDNPIIPSNLTNHITKEPFNGNFSLNITFLGGSATQQLDANVTLALYDPDSVQLAYKEYTVTVQEVDGIGLTGVDFQKNGDYRLELSVKKGSLYISYIMTIVYT